MKYIALFLCLIMMICMLSYPVSAETVGGYYEQLPSDAFREAYRLLEEGIAAMAPEIVFPREVGIRYVDMLEVARAVCLDHPEYFWFLETWVYELDTRDIQFLVDTFTPTYYLDNQQVGAGSQTLADAMITFHDKVNEIISGIPANYTDDYEIALYLHDYLAANVTYTLEGDHDSAYAALVHGKAACYGYSKAYQYLLSKAGIQSQIIVGDSRGEDGKLSAHAWNQVWIDGECFYTDVTWDDFERATIHQYFLMSLDEISVDHIADERFALPDCGHEIDYYEQSAGKGGGRITLQTTGAEAAAFFREVSIDGFDAIFAGNVRCTEDINTWFDSHAMELIRTLGLSFNTDIIYYSFGDVYHVILEDSNYRSVYPQAQSVTLNLSEITLRGTGSQVHLIPEIEPYRAGIRNPVFTSDREDVAVVDTSGMVTAVGLGTATITVSSFDGEVTAVCQIIVEEGDTHSHKLRLIPAYAPTCTLDGNAAYYICTDCNHRFEDEAAAIEILDISAFARLATGHVDLAWYPRTNTNSHQQVCACGAPIPRTIAPHTDNDGDDICDLCKGELAVNVPTEPVEPKKEAKLLGIPLIYWLCVGLLAGGIAAFVKVKRRY